ncbi:thymidine kinase [bacterium]|nr:thymidine kinase [bacterium]
MAKLYFRYGTVSSAKTLNLLAVFHNYGQQGKKAILIKPKTDSRFGASVVKSRAGLSVEADYVLPSNATFPVEALGGVHCVLVDEVQFFNETFIEELRKITCEYNIPVICYGLRTDFRTRSFEGSLRLMELADTVEEIKTTCSYCSKKAVFNLKIVGNLAVTDGPQIELGAEEKYQPTCAKCYSHKISECGDQIPRENEFTENNQFVQ